MRKSILLGLLLTIALPLHVLAVGQARMTGKVLDQEGKPIEGSTITLVATERFTFKETFPVQKSGEFTLAVVDGTVLYEFTVSAPGYTDYKEVIKLKLVPEKNERTFTLQKPGTAPGTMVAVTDPAIAAFNEGAQLANAGKVDEAIAKMEEAVKVKPELSAGYMALSKLYLRKENYPKAIENAEKALAIVGEDDDMFALLADAYHRTGNKEKEKEYRAKAPANAGLLYNEAVGHLNAGRDSEAEPLLKKALAADDKFADAYYQLGMVYVRSGKTADAKTNLAKYIELDPNGKDAAMAKEILKYLN